MPFVLLHRGEHAHVPLSGPQGSVHNFVICETDDGPFGGARWAAAWLNDRSSLSPRSGLWTVHHAHVR
jgi:hypothetical protein